MVIIVGIILAFIIVTPAISLGLVYKYYRKYYDYLKLSHYTTWEGLMKKDDAFESIGEWYRYPFGSGNLIKSFFTGETYGDIVITNLKRATRRSLKLFITSLIVAIIVIILLNNN